MNKDFGYIGKYFNLNLIRKTNFEDFLPQSVFTILNEQIKNDNELNHLNYINNNIKIIFNKIEGKENLSTLYVDIKGTQFEILDNKDKNFIALYYYKNKNLKSSLLLTDNEYKIEGKIFKLIEPQAEKN